MNLMLGSGLLTLYRFAAAIAPCEVERRPFTFATQDKARHVAYGMGHVRYHLARQPQAVATLGDYLDRTIQCVVLKIDEARRNIVVSRRKLLEDQREEMKKKLLAEIEPGQIRKGVVKNIADFGAFVDLGGIDGLLHVSDITWSGRGA